MYLKKEQNGYSLEDVTRTIRTLIETGRKNPAIREFAAGITGRIDGRQVDQLAQMIFAWIRKNIRYIYDPNGVEWIQAPEVTLKNRIGDCDDFTVLAGSLLESIGIRTQFNLVKTNGSDQFSHVFLSYWSPLKKKWIAFDAIVNKPMGWRSPAISGEKIMQVKGIGFVDPVTISTTIAIINALGDSGKVVNWLVGKNSLIGKWFGSNSKIVEADFIRAFNETFNQFGYGQKDLDWFHRLGNSSNYDCYLKVQGKRVAGARFSSISQGLKTFSTFILSHPYPGSKYSTLPAGSTVPVEQWDQYLNLAEYNVLAGIQPETKQATAEAVTKTTQTATTATTTGGLPNMPSDPRTLDNLNAAGLVQNGVAVTTTLIQLQVFANNAGIKGVSVPSIQPPSPVKANAVAYWDQVNKYRSALQNAVSSGYSYGGGNEGQNTPSGGGSTQTQEAGMGTAGMLLIGAAAAGLFLAARK